tara:strand:+ start:434 stop:628 length:195 start_codon:yes stop_codon:yes gene_type:complete
VEAEVAEVELEEIQEDLVDLVVEEMVVKLHQVLVLVKMELQTLVVVVEVQEMDPQQQEMVDQEL